LYPVSGFGFGRSLLLQLLVLPAAPACLASLYFGVAVTLYRVERERGSCDPFSLFFSFHFFFS
jgi:hypothetical protein